MSLTGTKLAASSDKLDRSRRSTSVPLRASNNLRKTKAPSPVAASKKGGLGAKMQNTTTSGSQKKRTDASQKSSAKHKVRPALHTIRKGTKQTLLIEMLRRAKGSTLAELVNSVGWKAHSIRGALSGSLKKKLGLVIASRIVEGRGRVYRITH